MPGEEMEKLTKPEQWIFENIRETKASLKYFGCKDYLSFAENKMCIAICAFNVMLVANYTKLLRKEKRTLMNKILPELEKMGYRIEHDFDSLSMEELYKFVQAFRDKETVIKIHRVLRGMEVNI